MDVRWFEAVREAIGVTRVARITGLDRTGVEVACAIRPTGHVLQVCNGKGTTFEQAALGALMEAAELAGAERVSPGPLVAPNRVAGALGPREVGSAALHVAPSLADREARIAWRDGVDLSSGEQVHVPAAAVHCPPPGAAWLGPSALSWTSNGSAAHPLRTQAIRHALLEAIERDQLARAAPQGWTGELVARRRIDPGVLRRTALLGVVERIERAGFEVALFDLTPHEGGVGLMVAGALLRDVESGPIPLTAGYACRGDPVEALHAALLEAAQSRLTDVHGAREDVAAADPAGVAELTRVLAQRHPPAVTKLRARTGSDAGALVRRLVAAGHRRVIAVDLVDEPALPLHVVKVVVPTLQMTELL